MCDDGKYPKDKPIIWINMRQEPIIYVNGNPVRNGGKMLQRNDVIDISSYEN